MKPIAKQENTKQTQVADQAQDKDLFVISNYLKELRFSPRIMGVDEADVWKKIEKLCELYEDALAAERGKNVKLTKQLAACANRIKKLMAAENTEEDKPNG